MTYDASQTNQSPATVASEASRVCTLGVLWADRLVGHVLGIVARLGFGGCDAAEAVHEALLVEPRHVVGGDELDVAERAQRTASERY